MHRFVLLAALAAVLSCPGAPKLRAQPLQDTAVLVVTAHPDDEAMFAGSLYRVAQELGGRVDLALVTDGAGGYRYSNLAERIYGVELTNPDVARQYLPAIRKQELMAGGRIIGFRQYYFLDQPDTGKTTDPDSILATVWNADFVLNRLTEILRSNRYDFVLTSLPRSDTHGHHKAAAILALRASQQLVDGKRPVVMGAWISDVGDETVLTFDGLDGYPESETISATSSFRFDKTQPLAGNDRLNYKIPVNWLIAEHKSQGTMQLFVNRGDIEEYWVYHLNPPDAVERAAGYFDALNNFVDSHGAPDGN
ncbi:MAG: PIG-L family deacetylase [Rhodothermales bacterium]|nr:PIG-L family deacetylase [Rhodothermales bacterium]